MMQIAVSDERLRPGAEMIAEIYNLKEQLRQLESLVSFWKTMYEQQAAETDDLREQMREDARISGLMAAYREASSVRVAPRQSMICYGRDMRKGKTWI